MFGRVGTDPFLKPGKCIGKGETGGGKGEREMGKGRKTGGQRSEGERECLGVVE